MSSQHVMPMHRALHLTMDEAMTLLEMCLYASADDDPVKAEVISKLATVCRELMRSEGRQSDLLAAADGHRFAGQRERVVIHRRAAPAVCA